MKKNYIIIPLITIVVSVLGSLVTNNNIDWYDALSKPSFTPPGFVIGTVWTVLYIFATMTALIVWNSLPRNKIFKWIVAFLIINAVLNLLWTFIFFGQQMVLLSIIEMILLNITVIVLIVLIWPMSKLAASLLFPYTVWVTLVTYLAYQILVLNQ
jgi:translocator protein